jgi:hypothetical protein
VWSIGGLGTTPKTDCAVCCIGLVFQLEATRFLVTNAALSLLWISQLFNPVRPTVSLDNALRSRLLSGQEALTHLTESRGACLSRRKFYNVTRLLLLL